MKTADIYPIVPALKNPLDYDTLRGHLALDAAYLSGFDFREFPGLARARARMLDAVEAIEALMAHVVPNIAIPPFSVIEGRFEAWGDV